MASKMPISALIFLVLCDFASGLQCMDPSNNPVDWYVIYKLPKQRSHINPSIRKGLGFMYMSSRMESQWGLSEVDINDTSCMVAHTLSLQGENNVYLLYNDQPPHGAASELKGHTKGVVMANASGGFWLIHSVPHFPLSLEQYAYPKSGTHFGQSFLCLSLGLEALNSVGLQLLYNEPLIYAQNVPEALKERLPVLYKAANNETIQSAPWYHVQNITSSAGLNFLSFAKARMFSKDLYADLVSPALESNLYVETWPNEPHRLPSNCQHKFQVDNILSVSSQNPEVSFSATVDHSKWAVSTPEDLSKWVCIGDINRAVRVWEEDKIARCLILSLQKRQTMRGGGTTCLNSNAVASRYLEIVASVQKCEKPIKTDEENAAGSKF